MQIHPTISFDTKLTDFIMEKVKCLIIGSGPAGYTAAIYAGRANLSPVVVSGMQPGGQLTITTDIENYPGFPEPIGGYELMERFQEQAIRYGARLLNSHVTEVDFSHAPYSVVTSDGATLRADTVIIATGASAKYLGLPDEQKYAGAGVSACATCDGFFYRGKTVAVVGGGDTACEEAAYLSNIADKVYLVVRKPYLRASKIMQHRVSHTPNIEILYSHQVRGLSGEPFVERATLVHHTPEGDKEVEIAIDGLFLAIGHHPNTELFRPWLHTDEAGYLVTVSGTPRTALPGVFAAGDVADPHYRQAVTAAASGCQAAIEAERYLQAAATREEDVCHTK